METQRIALFGATTKMGEGILNEALNRGHKVTAIVPQPEKIKKTHNNLEVVRGDVMNKNDICSKIKGHDVVISAYEVKTNPAEHVRYTRNLVDAVNTDEIRQLIVMGHPGATEIESTVQVPATADAWKAIAEAQQQALEALEDNANNRWSYVHLPELATPGKSGKPRPSSQILVKSTESEQYFPLNEYPQAVVDDAEHYISHAQSEL